MGQTNWYQFNAPSGRFYTIRRDDEETSCRQCGAPLYKGDRAMMTSADYVYCGTACARQAGE